MMLKTIYATAEDIPEGYADLYTERNGQWELTGIQGVKTQADVDRVQQSLRKERSDHKETKDKLALFGDLDPDTVQEKLGTFDTVMEQYEALKASGGGWDEEKAKPLIEAEVRKATGPLEREKTNLQRQLDQRTKEIAERDGTINELKTTIVTTNVDRALRDAAVDAKVQGSAIQDALLRGRNVFEQDPETGKLTTKDIPGVTPGLSPKEWFKEMEEHAPHWWPQSQGGGSGGRLGGGPGGGKNPWSKEAWSITEQGKFLREHGIDKATQMAERAGVKIGATKPAAA
jgi:hypothetical protein